MQRPTVNLDKVASFLDGLLDHPLAQLAGEFAPITVGAIRTVRENLPEVASGLEARAVDRVKVEAHALEREVLGSLQRFLAGTVKKGRGPRPKRLKAKKGRRLR
jgi:hypothetical protein